jgi:hypothetical protein
LQSFGDNVIAKKEEGPIFLSAHSGCEAPFQPGEHMHALFAEADLEHAIPGRVRIRFRSRRGDVPFFKALVSHLGTLPAVEEVEANPRTGGVLIRHTLDEAAFGKLAGEFGLDTSPRAAAPAGKRHKLNGSVSIDTAALAALSMVQAIRGRGLASASEQLWQASQAARLDLPALAGPLLFAALVQVMRGRVLAPASSLMMFALILAGRRAAARAGGPRLP